MAILGAGVWVGWQTVSLGLDQLKSVNAGLSSSAAAAVYQQQQGINNIFVQHPDMNPYFSYKKQVPEGAPDRSKIESVAFRLLDHFEHIRYQLDNGLFDTDHEAWEFYIRSSFSRSPILCGMLWNSAAEYEGTGDGTLWKDFAASPCAEFGIGP